MSKKSQYIGADGKVLPVKNIYKGEEFERFLDRIPNRVSTTMYRQGYWSVILIVTRKDGRTSCELFVRKGYDTPHPYYDEKPHMLEKRSHRALGLCGLDTETILALGILENEGRKHPMTDELWAWNKEMRG